MLARSAEIENRPPGTAAIAGGGTANNAKNPLRKAHLRSGSCELRNVDNLSMLEFLGFLFHDPDIAIRDRISVGLQVEGSLARMLLGRAARG